MTENTLFWLVTAMIVLIETPAYIFFAACFLGTENINIKKIGWIFAFRIALALITSTFFLSPLCQALISILAMFVYTLFFTGRLKMKLISAALMYCVGMVFELLSAVICSLLSGLSIPEMMASQAMFIVLSITSRVLYLVFAAALCFLRRNALGAINIAWREFALLLVLPATLLVFLILSANLLVSLFLSPLLIFALAASIALIILIHIYFVYRLNYFHKKELSSSALDQRIRFETERAEAALASYSQIRKVTHDFQHHLFALEGLLQSNAYGAASEYIGSLTQTVRRSVAVVNTNNPIVDAILNQKYYHAAACGVTLEFDLCNLSDCKINSVDLVVVVSNLLDNAIEAAQKVPGQPFVHIRMRNESGELILSVINDVKENVTIPDDCAIPSSKGGGKTHGYGLLNVITILNRLHGVFCMESVNRKFQFTAIIPNR